MFSFLCVLVLIVTTTANVTEGKFFRNDYEFNNEANAWMKIHQMPSTWSEANIRCNLEGAKLASPLNIELLKMMVSNISHRKTFSTGVFTGISAVHSKGDFYSVEGVPLRKIPVNWAPQEPNNYLNSQQCILLNQDGSIRDVSCEGIYPYICYRPYSNITLSPDCGTIDLSYRYSNVTGHCYKFHALGQHWDIAFTTCSAEGGYLTIINSEEEANILKDLYNEFPNSVIQAEFVHTARIGIAADPITFEWRTIHGQTLAEAGYDNWNSGEPNSNFRFSCAGITRNGRLDDIRCPEHVPFICEKTPP